MIKSLRSPEKIFHLTMWLVSLVFASFLIGLGGKIISDLRGSSTEPVAERYGDQARIAELRQQATTLEAGQRSLGESATLARYAARQAATAYDAAKASFDSWISTRVATGDRTQDPELVARTQALEQLRKAAEAARQNELQADQRLVDATTQLGNLRSDEEAAISKGASAYDAALRRFELQVFGTRLLFTLPLLALAGWFIARKRASRYWPLMRGFVIAALVAFFVELLPYLPSYGGYVRYAVGIALTLVAGHYGIRWMQGYLARRQAEEVRSEAERRAHMNAEEALRKLNAGICPSCERPVMTTDAVPADFCVHCGLKLYDHCLNCSKRKNAYFNHCMGCGTPAKPAAVSG